MKSWIGAVIVLAFVSACGSIPGLGQPVTPTASGSVRLPPTIEVRFEVEVPPHPRSNGQIVLEYLDTVTGGSYNSTEHPMQEIEPGRWSVVLQEPHGALIRYRYQQRGTGRTLESDLDGSLIHYRVASLSGTTLIRDVVANWGTEAVSGPGGRILGQVSAAADGSPLPEILIAAAGKLTFSDGEGRFRLEGLPPGEHNLVAFSPDGQFLPSAQGAVVAAESTTPADMRMSRAPLVQLTFEVRLPPDTPAGLPIRLAGNTAATGDHFLPLQGGVQGSSAHMPQLVRVGADQAILLTQAYAGTDLRYKYTMGDGLWSAERRDSGGLLIRRMIVPGEASTILDRVARWQPESGSVLFNVTVPDDWPDSARLGLQLNPGIWFEPLPLSHNEQGMHQFWLAGPITFQGPLEYRFCQNFDCPAGALPIDGTSARTASLETVPQDLSIDHQVGESGITGPFTPTVVAPELDAGSGWQVGVEIAPAYRPGWVVGQNELLSDARDLASTHVILSPTWLGLSSGGFPLLEFDPRAARTSDQVLALREQAQDRGLQLMLHPRFMPAMSSPGSWWTSGSSDIAWWDVFFEELRSYLVTQAAIAQQVGAQRLILGGPEYLPTYPMGATASQSGSAPPSDADDRWRTILTDLRTVYDGELAWEVDATQPTESWPEFLGQFDVLHVGWSHPVGENPTAELAELQIVASERLSVISQVARGLDLPIVLSVGYPSDEAALSGCGPLLKRACPMRSNQPAGAGDAPAGTLGLQRQAEAVNAVLLAAYSDNQVIGFFSRGYDPINARIDSTISTRGKPADSVLWYWYQRLTAPNDS